MLWYNLFSREEKKKGEKGGYLCVSKKLTLSYVLTYETPYKSVKKSVTYICLFAEHHIDNHILY